MMAKTLEELLEEREAVLVGRDAELDLLRKALEDECRAAWKARFPRRKFSMAKSAKDNQPFHGETCDRNRAEYKAAFNRWEDLRREVEAKLDSAALEADVPAFEGMSLYATVDSGTYRSQGFGEHRYARADAEDVAGKARSYGLEAHVREVLRASGRDMFGHSFRCVDYEVWISTSEVGCEVLTRKQDKRTMADWVKDCDKRGVNPRVYFPFMSYEQEEKLRRAK